MTEYAIYKGDQFIDLGTVSKLAQKFGVKPDTIKFWSRPSYLKRIKDNALIAIRIEDD